MDGKLFNKWVIRLLSPKARIPLEQGSPLVTIIDVKCPKCLRKFRTVPAVVEHTGAVYCSACGARMEVSTPQPVSVLSTMKLNRAV
jgi:uncharacterized Zn finger protein (UPF0148 family)